MAHAPGIQFHATSMLTNSSRFSPFVSDFIDFMVLSSVVFRLLLFVDEADAFLRKRNQVKKK